MRPAFIILAGAGIACLALGVLGWSTREAARTAEKTIVSETQRRDHLRAQLLRAEARLAAAETEMRRLQSVPANPPPRTESAPAARPAVMKLDGNAAAAMAAFARVPWREVVLAKNPELQARYLAVRRAELAADYGPFWASARWSPAQIEGFIAAMIVATERTLDLKSAAHAQGLEESDPALTALREQSESQVRAAQRELLGEAGYAQLVEYERTRPMRGFVSALAGSLAVAEAPLSGPQAEQLTQILAEANEAYRSGGRAASPGPDIDGPMRARQPARVAFDSQQVLMQAKPVLSPAQFERFEAEIRRIQAITDLFNVIRQTPDDPIIGFTIIGRK